MVIFKGTAHPPAHRLRQNTADLCDAEIRTTNMAGRPMLLEHNYGARIGEVLTSYRGPKETCGSSDMSPIPSASKRCETGRSAACPSGRVSPPPWTGKNLLRNPEELSLCAEGGGLERGLTKLMEDEYGAWQTFQRVRAAALSRTPCRRAFRLRLPFPRPVSLPAGTPTALTITRVCGRSG